MGGQTSKGKSGDRSVSNKRSSFKDSIRSLTNRRHKDPEEIPEDKGEKIKLEVPVENYTFPFENIVFEEGGIKSLAYCGAVRCLEELGIWRQITRISGTGHGSVIAALLSVGYNSYQLERYLSQDIRYMFTDHSCGCCGFYNNITKRFGLNHAKKFYRWFGERIKDYVNDADITFMQVLKKFGRELCIVVTNVSEMRCFYCHPKTTPDMPIRLAVRMCMTIPGIIQPVSYDVDDFKQYFVDGSILCSYPVHCFDGWWLSMKADDSFVARLHPLSTIGQHLDVDNRFGEYNDRTLGLMVYSDYEEEGLQYILDRRPACEDEVKLPDTKLAREAKEKKGARKYSADKHADLSVALKIFLKALNEHGLDETKALSKKDLENILSKRTELSDIDLRILFGKNCSADSIFKVMNVQPNDNLEVAELVRHFDSRGLRYSSHYANYRRRQIKTIGNYLLALSEGLIVARSQVKKRDLERTVGINTHHIGVYDYNLEREDRKFLVAQGKMATKRFLEYYVSRKLPKSSSDVVKDGDDDDDIITQLMDDELSEIIDHRDYMDDFKMI